MKAYMRIFLSIMTFTFLAFAGYGIMNRVHAQQELGGNGFSISPLIQQLPSPDEDRQAIDPGEELSFNITIRNITSQPLVARAEFNDFVPREESGSPRIIIDEEDQTEYGLRQYFEPIDDVTLQPGESAEVPVRLSLPFNITPGGHYGIVRFTALSPSSGETVALSASVGTIVLVNVAGEIEENIDLVEISAAKNGETGSFFESGPLAIVTRLQNTGNTHVQPFGTVIVRNFLGNITQQFEFNEARGNILPESIRRFENPLENRFFFGPYSLEASISYGNGGDIITSTQTFWVLPYKVILVAIASLAALFLAIRYGLKSYKQRVLNSANKK